MGYVQSVMVGTEVYSGVRLYQRVMRLVEDNQRGKHRRLSDFLRFDKWSCKFYVCDSDTGLWTDVSEDYVSALIYHYALKKKLPLSTRGLSMCALRRNIILVARDFAPYRMNRIVHSPPNVYVEAAYSNAHYWYFSNGLWCFELKKFISKVPSDLFLLDRDSCGYEYTAPTNPFYCRARDQMLAGMFARDETCDLFLKIVAEHMRNQRTGCGSSGHLILLQGPGACQLVELLQLVFGQFSQSIIQVGNRGLALGCQLIFSSSRLDYSAGICHSVVRYCLEQGRLVVLRVGERPADESSCLFMHVDKSATLVCEDEPPYVARDHVLRRQLFFDLIASIATYEQTPLEIALATHLCYKYDHAERLSEIARLVQRAYSGQYCSVSDEGENQLILRISSILSNAFTNCLVNVSEDLCHNIILKINA